MYNIEYETESKKIFESISSVNHIEYSSYITSSKIINKLIKKNVDTFDFEIRNYDILYLKQDFQKFFVKINDLILEQSDIFKCLKIIRNSINDREYINFIDHIDNLIYDHINTLSEVTVKPINFNSFKQFIEFSLSKKVQKSEIRIDSKTGNFCLYSSDKNDYQSRKISLIFNEKDIIYSVLSRDHGLAKISGKCVLKQPDANHKIDLLMDLFKF